MITTNTRAWNRAVDMLSRACTADRLGRGRPKRVFVATLRLYADELEKLIPVEPCGTKPTAPDP